MAVLQAVERFGTPHNSWLISMLERKPRMRVAIALANKMARGLWAMVTKQEDYTPRGTMARAQCAVYRVPRLECVRRSMDSKRK
jgi:transposase